MQSNLFRPIALMAGVSVVYGSASARQPRDRTDATCGAESIRDGRRELTVCRRSTELTVDGRVEPAEWAGAAEFDLPYEVFPGTNTPSVVSTRCFVAFDDERLWLGCDARDPDPGGMRAFLTQRDDVDGQDRIGFVVDPFNDSRRAFEFVVTALGVQADGVLGQEEGTLDPSWDAHWQSAGRIGESGFQVEASIPFASLRFPRSEGAQTWGFYAWRVRLRSDEVEMRSVRVDRGSRCLLCQAGLLSGFEGLSPGRNVRLSPTLTGSRKDARPESGQGPLETGRIGTEIGADLEWSPAPDMSLAATFNPDFSQVEADVAQLDVNNRFTLLFPEKRPFFLEGAEFFATPLRTVYTRTISNPVLGTRVAGKFGRAAYAGIVAQDRVNNLLFPSNQESSTASLNQDVTVAILRARSDVGATSTLGGLLTRRDGTDYRNTVAGIDGFFRLARPLSARLQLLRSGTLYPDSLARAYDQPVGQFAGSAFLLETDFNTRDWHGMATARLLDPGFRADAGFVEQVDLRDINGYFQRRFRGSQDGWYSIITLTGGGWNTSRSDGLRTERVLWANTMYLGPSLARMFLDYQHRSEFYSGETYMLNRYRAEVGISPSRSIRVETETRFGDAIDLANARKAGWARFVLGIRLRLGRHVDLDLAQRMERLSNRGEPIVTAYITELRAIYSFSTRAFIRAIVQHRITENDPNQYTIPVDRRTQYTFAQVLFGYEVSPQTLFYLGYSDERSGLTQTDGAIVPVHLTSRALFVKLSYAWRP